VGRGQDNRFRQYEVLADGAYRATGRVAGDKVWRLNGHDGMLHQFELTTIGSAHHGPELPATVRPVHARPLVSVAIVTQLVTRQKRRT
jgi:hypothetical protein